MCIVKGKRKTNNIKLVEYYFTRYKKILDIVLEDKKKTKLLKLIYYFQNTKDDYESFYHIDFS